jgi:hypothetical protein
VELLPIVTPNSLIRARVQIVEILSFSITQALVFPRA